MAPSLLYVQKKILQTLPQEDEERFSPFFFSLPQTSFNFWTGTTPFPLQTSIPYIVGYSEILLLYIKHWFSEEPRLGRDFSAKPNLGLLWFIETFSVKNRPSQSPTVPVCVCAQPPMVACKIGSSVRICTRCMHVFLHVSRRFVCSVGAYQQNFCVGAQSEVCQECVRCWLGVELMLRCVSVPPPPSTQEQVKLLFFFLLLLPQPFHVLYWPQSRVAVQAGGGTEHVLQKKKRCLKNKNCVKMWERHCCYFFFHSKNFFFQASFFLCPFPSSLSPSPLLPPSGVIKEKRERRRGTCEMGSLLFHPFFFN